MELDLSSLYVESEDIAHVFKAFPRLKALRLESCKKLGPRVVKVLHSNACTSTCNVDGSRNEFSEGSTSSGYSGKRLEVLDVRRCYQLTAEALTVFLHRMAESQLRGVLLSHLSLQSWPWKGSSWAETCNLQILALNNSFLLTPAGLQVCRHNTAAVLCKHICSVILYTVFGKRPLLEAHATELLATVWCRQFR